MSTEQQQRPITEAELAEMESTIWSGAHPDGIIRLLAEIRRLRAALRDIAEDKVAWRTTDDLKNRAREALEGK